MGLSAKKLAQLETRKRQALVNVRSLDGKGYFMDAGHNSLARKYIDTGDLEILNELPDYRVVRKN